MYNAYDSKCSRHQHLADVLIRHGLVGWREPAHFWGAPWNIGEVLTHFLKTSHSIFIFEQVTFFPSNLFNWITNKKALWKSTSYMANFDNSFFRVSQFYLLKLVTCYWGRHHRVLERLEVTEPNIFNSFGFLWAKARVRVRVMLLTHKDTTRQRKPKVIFFPRNSSFFAVLRSLRTEVGMTRAGGSACDFPIPHPIRLLEAVFIRGVRRLRPDAAPRHHHQVHTLEAKSKVKRSILDEKEGSRFDAQSVSQFVELKNGKNVASSLSDSLCDKNFTQSWEKQSFCFDNLW